MKLRIERFSDAAAELGQRTRGLERDLERTRKWGLLGVVPATFTLIALNIAVFVWESTFGGLDDVESVFAVGALIRDRVLAGEWWRLLTATMLHTGIEHLAYNMVVLFQLGAWSEAILGAKSMLAIYAGGALAGSLLSVTFSPGPSVGASGAIFGLWAGLALSVRRHERRSGVKLLDSAALVGYASLALLQGLLNPRVDNLAHLGGVLGGGILGFFVKVRY